MPAPAPIPPPRARHGERGFSLIELIVVLVILAILLSMFMLRLADKTPPIKVTIGIGETYAQAIDDFAADHGGRMPQFGTPDWPVASDGPVMHVAKDPVTPYIRRGAPKEVVEGWVDLGNADGPGSKGKGHLEYIRLGAERYELKVYVNQRYRCSLGTLIANEADVCA